MPARGDSIGAHTAGALALSSTTSLTDLLCLFKFRLDSKRVGAASVGPHVGKCDLFRCPTLKKELSGSRVKQETRECAMEETCVDVGHEMAFLLASIANVAVIVVEHDATLFHEADLLLIVAYKAGIDRCSTRRCFCDGCGHGVGVCVGYLKEEEQKGEKCWVVQGQGQGQGGPLFVGRTRRSRWETGRRVESGGRVFVLPPIQKRRLACG